MYSELYEELAQILIEALRTDQDVAEISVQNLSVLCNLVGKSKTPDMVRIEDSRGYITYKFNTPVVIASSVP